MIFGLFDAGAIISLPERTDRRSAMRAQVKSIGAADAVAFFDAVRPEAPGEFPSIGARGCFMSHLGVLQQAEMSGAGSVVIFEDDLNFSDDIEALAPAVRAALSDEDWSVFYGGWEDPFAALPASPVAPIVRLDPETELRCSHFIAFNGPVIPRVRSYLETLSGRSPGHPEGGPMHVDGAYNRFRQANPDLAAFAATPPLGYQRSSRSDIFPLKWYDRTPGVAFAVNFLRRFRRGRR